MPSRRKATDPVRLVVDNDVTQHGPPREAAYDFEDSFRTGYRKDKFVTNANDSHGHHEVVRVKFPTFVNGRMQELVQSRKWPYRTTHDLVRDAVYHRLHDLDEMSELPADVRSVVRLWEIASTEVQKRVERRMVEEYIAGREAGLREAAAGGDKERVGQLVEVTYSDMDVLNLTDDDRLRLFDLLKRYR